MWDKDGKFPKNFKVSESFLKKNGKYGNSQEKLQELIFSWILSVIDFYGKSHRSGNTWKFRPSRHDSGSIWTDLKITDLKDFRSVIYRSIYF